MIDRFVIAADRLRNAKVVTRIGVATVTHNVLGVEIVGVGTALAVLRRRRKVRMMYTFDWERKHREVLPSIIAINCSVNVASTQNLN